LAPIEKAFYADLHEARIREDRRRLVIGIVIAVLALQPIVAVVAYYYGDWLEQRDNEVWARALEEAIKGVSSDDEVSRLTARSAKLSTTAKDIARDKARYNSFERTFASQVDGVLSRMVEIVEEQATARSAAEARVVDLEKLIKTTDDTIRLKLQKANSDLEAARRELDAQKREISSLDREIESLRRELRRRNKIVQERQAALDTCSSQLVSVRASERECNDRLGIIKVNFNACNRNLAKAREQASKCLGPTKSDSDGGASEGDLNSEIEGEPASK
jgi:chromosome segregation ATPase